jgi:hypothetical protein
MHKESNEFWECCRNIYRGQSEYTYAAVRISIENGNIYRGQSEDTYVFVDFYLLK